MYLPKSRFCKTFLFFIKITSFISIFLQVNITGEVYQNAGAFGGTYELSESKLVNGKNHWISKTGFRAIWNYNGTWIIGLSSGLGSNTGFISAPVSPFEDPTYLCCWKYGNVEKFWENEIKLLDFSSTEGITYHMHISESISNHISLFSSTRYSN